jgi:hypothetical protein
MSALPSFAVEVAAPLGAEVRRFDIHTFEELASRVRELAYGRPVSASLLAVLAENQGTCSSKHRLLAAVAHELLEGLALLPRLLCLLRGARLGPLARRLDRAAVINVAGAPAPDEHPDRAREADADHREQRWERQEV